MFAVPTKARHYYRAIRRPFMNLSDLHGVQLDSTIQELIAERRAGQHHRAFGRRYMDLRRQTEERLRRLFVEAGGLPERDAPHYFVLGESRWFEGLAPDMRFVELDLDVLPPDATSVTYPDSFTAMGLAPEYGLPYEPKPYHGRVYRLDDLPELVAELGLPVDGAGDYDGYERRPFERYIEIQLWSDGPVAHLR